MAENAGALEQFEGSYPSSMSPPAARQKFESLAVQLRSRQRSALRQAASRLANGQSGNLSDRERETLMRIVKHWENASDVPKALEHAAQLGIELPLSWREQIDRELVGMQAELEIYRIAKLRYRDYLSGVLADAWPGLSLGEKRQRVSQWMSLIDEQPGWLLARRPLNTSYPLHATAKLQFEAYEQAERRLIAEAYAPWAARLAQLKSQAQRIAGLNSPDLPARAAANLVQLLDAPYAQGLRGLLLIEVGHGHHPNLELQLRATVAEVERTLENLLVRQAAVVADLDRQLENLRADLRHRHLFKELLLVDIEREQIVRLWKPLRVYAQRGPGVTRFEAAYLIVRRQGQFTVEYLIDGQQQTLSRQQVWLFPEELPPNFSIARRVPPTGPGVPVTPQTSLDGQVLCHTARSWQPVTVIDESPFGVEIAWQNSDEPMPVLEQRTHMRIAR